MNEVQSAGAQYRCNNNTPYIGPRVNIGLAGQQQGSDLIESHPRRPVQRILPTLVAVVVVVVVVMRDGDYVWCVSVSVCPCVREV